MKVKLVTDVTYDLNGPIKPIRVLESAFFGIGPWKTRRIVCCRDSLALWVGLNTVRYSEYDPLPTHDEEKKAITSYPFKAHATCRCKECRYLRLWQKHHGISEPPASWKK
jgi:hypothetical protein